MSSPDSAASVSPTRYGRVVRRDDARKPAFGKNLYTCLAGLVAPNGCRISLAFELSLQQHQLVHVTNGRGAVGKYGVVVALEAEGRSLAFFHSLA